MHQAIQLALIATVVLSAARAAQHPLERSLANQLGSVPSFGTNNTTAPNELTLERCHSIFDRGCLTFHGDHPRNIVDHWSHHQCDTINQRLTLRPPFAGRTSSHMERPSPSAHADDNKVICNTQLVVGNLTVNWFQLELLSANHGRNQTKA